LRRDSACDAFHGRFHDRFALVAGTAAARRLVIVTSKAGKRPAAAGASAVLFGGILLGSLATVVILTVDTIVFWQFRIILPIVLALLAWFIGEFVGHYAGRWLGPRAPSASMWFVK